LLFAWQVEILNARLADLRTSIQPTQERIHNLENSLALARAAAGTERHAPGSLPTSQTAEGAQLETGLEIKNGVPNGGVFNGGFGSDRGSGGKVPQSPSPHNWAPMNPSRSSDLACDAARQASAQHGTTMGGTHHRRSNSFTSTPGRGRGVPSLNDDVDEGTRLLAVENERLREHHDTNRIEHELLRTEFEHAKSQTALLRESNRNYEERVTQLERLVRECNAQTSSLRSQLADFTAGGERAKRRGPRGRRVRIAEGVGAPRAGGGQSDVQGGIRRSDLRGRHPDLGAHPARELRPRGEHEARGQLLHVGERGGERGEERGGGTRVREWARAGFPRLERRGV
jgi:hypothetical protein